MCGIGGIVNLNNLKPIPILKQILINQEHRGKQGCGIGFAKNNRVKIFKNVVEPRKFRLPKAIENMRVRSVIGHNRQPTCSVNIRNTHPFYSCDKKIALVHNGWISNYELLLAVLRKHNHKIRSTCDSEILVHLIEGGDIEENMKIFKKVSGLLNVLIIDNEGTIYVWKENDVSIVKTDDFILIASEESAIRDLDIIDKEREYEVIDVKREKPLIIYPDGDVVGDYEVEKRRLRSTQTIFVRSTSAIRDCPYKNGNYDDCKVKNYMSCKYFNPDCPYKKTSYSTQCWWENSKQCWWERWVW